MHSGTLSVLCLLALAVFAAPVAANFVPHDKCYFIRVKNYYAPYYTFAVYKDIATGFDCSKYCADDDYCVAYTFEKNTRRCALKHDSDGCMELLDAETGIKYIGKYKPVLKDNDVHADVYYVKDLPYYKPVVKKPRSNVVSATATAVSTGGTVVSGAYADNYGRASHVNYVEGNGYSFTTTETPYIYLAVGLSKNTYYPAYTAEYYKEAKSVAVCKNIHGKDIYFYAPKKEEPKQSYGYDTPCHVQKDYGYNGYAIEDVIYTFKSVVDPGYCCSECRKHVDCLAWEHNPYVKECYLIKKVTKVKTAVGYFSGSCL